MRTYRRVTYEDRCHIFKLKTRGFSVSQIAKQLNFNSTTIYRELSRNSKDSNYCPFEANNLYKTRFRHCRKKFKIVGKLEAIVDLT